MPGGRFSFRQRPEGKGFHLGRAKVLYLTERALRVELLDGPHQGLGAEGDEACWIPKSQLHSESEINDESFVDVEGELVVTQFIATQRGWTT